jgi:hypothetical protein
MSNVALCIIKPPLGHVLGPLKAIGPLLLGGPHVLLDHGFLPPNQTNCIFWLDFYIVIFKIII